MLDVKDLSAGYGRIPALHGISLTVKQNSSVGILGRNGMGKTTLLRALIGQLPAMRGQITYDGTDLTRSPSHKRARAGMGYVPQGRQIFNNLTVMDNLRMGCVKHFETADETIERVMLDFPRLSRLLDQPGGALSGGEQQLLALARCLCGNPSIILLDEPTEGIQPNICEEIIETLNKLRQANNLTIILVEQDIDFLVSLSEELMIIDKGALIASVDPTQMSVEEIAEKYVGFHAH
jgi:branched-chain amino acid transport system ATP-binding protein/urea transport system ATP-binding protein